VAWRAWQGAARADEGGTDEDKEHSLLLFVLLIPLRRAMSLRSQGGITGQGGQQLRPQFNQTQQPSQDSAFTSYPKSTSNNTLSSTQSSQPSRQDMGQQRVATPNSQPGPPQQQAPVSGPSSSSYAKPPPISLEQSRQIAKTHFDALRDWLRRENGLANGSTRNSESSRGGDGGRHAVLSSCRFRCIADAREKLTRLTRQQFQELSTDVYDELVRRMEEGAGRPGDRTFRCPLPQVQRRTVR
jgi:transglutaminase-like putative cysteine protease